MNKISFQSMKRIDPVATAPGTDTKRLDPVATAPGTDTFMKETR